MLNSNLVIISGKVDVVKSKKEQTDKGLTTVSRFRLTHTDYTGRQHRFIIECRGRTADKVSNYQKGTNVIVKAGRIMMDKFTDGNSTQTLVLVYAIAIAEIPAGTDLCFNTVVFSGRLTREPVLQTVKTSKGDKKVLNITLCYNDLNGVPHFVAVDVWNKLAESSNSAKKGSMIEVRGSLIYKEWGNNKSQTLINANELDFVSAPINA